jgi:cell division protein FtsQ
VAFVRQGTEIGLVDANGVLFDLPDPGTGTKPAPHYSFPVLTGISVADPLSTRAARIRIYLGFMAALDATGEGVSHRLSEVDLSNPEDIKAIIPDTGASNEDILVHFGEEKYLERYHLYQQHLAEWRSQYPHLASVDMRYERQVVLQMQPGSAAAATAGAPSAAGIEPAPIAANSPTSTKPAATLRGASARAKKPAARPAHKHVAAVHLKPASHASVAPKGAPR